MIHKKQSLLVLVTLALLSGACGRAPKQPAETLAAACEAARLKDTRAYQETLSRDKLSNLRALAARSNMSTDELLMQLIGNINCPERTQAGVTHFQGETATLDVKAADSEEIERYRFVREGGDWKFAD
ncbi:MAG TPA: hypothetical protein VF297_21365 [Pyrinomonadaceae bacterium]